MEYIKSPMNYTGGKHRLLPQILPLFPPCPGTFIDLFAGGLNVGINVKSGKLLCCDKCGPLIDLYTYMRDIGGDAADAWTRGRIETLNLSTKNRDGYLTLRERYNKEHKPMDLFVLACHSFNHMIRFNRNGEFNVPFGKDKGGYNESIHKNLLCFCDMLQKKDVSFFSGDFRDVGLDMFGEGDFVYADPPYLISEAAYNAGWGESEEAALLSLLDRLHMRGIKFALSNVTKHKGKENGMLMQWAKKYKTHMLSMSYSNCSYNLKDKKNLSEEVLVTNYFI